MTLARCLWGKVTQKARLCSLKLRDGWLMVRVSGLPPVAQIVSEVAPLLVLLELVVQVGRRLMRHHLELRLEQLQSGVVIHKCGLLND